MMLHLLRVAAIAITVVGICWLHGLSATPTQTPSPTATPLPTSPPWVRWYKNPDALSITLSTDKLTYKMGDDVLLKIKETNTSSDPIQFNPLRACVDYDIYISHSTSLMKPLPLGMRNNCGFYVSGRPYFFVIAPQATITEPGGRGEYTSISDWGLKISDPGKYYIIAISVYIQQHPLSQKYSDNVQLSNVAEITVAP